MSDPNPNAIQDDDHLYVSSTSDDTLAERYAKVRAKEVEMTSAELLKALRLTPSLFDWEHQTIKPRPPKHKSPLRRRR